MKLMGELGMYYEAADWVSLGTDHNLLEPIGYSRPARASGHGQAAYLGSPVSRPALQAELIVHVPQIRNLRLTTWYPTTTDKDRPKAERRRRVDALTDGDQGRIVSLKQDLVFAHLSLSPSASA